MIASEEKTHLFDHIEELRRTFIQCLSIVTVGVALAFFCYQPLIEWITAPYSQKQLQYSPFQTEILTTSRIHNRTSHEQLYTLPKGGEVAEWSAGVEPLSSTTYRMGPGAVLTITTYTKPTRDLIVLGPLDGMSIALKTAFWVGLILTAPLWAFCIARFVIPALRIGERRVAALFVLVSAAFMAFGALFAYYMTIPIANAYLAQFNAAIGQNWWTLRNYLDYTFFLVGANALAFECGAVGMFAVHFGVITADFLIRNRRIAIVMAFIVGALLTPPDVATQVMMAIPLMALYETVILYAKVRERLSLRMTHVD